MASIGALFVGWAESVWNMLLDSAFLLLLGILLAGLIHLILSEKNLSRILKGKKGEVILRSALVGIPLPLCSCSVLPVASQLRRSGLSRGGTAAFLIATPETGIDSVLLTYSLTDPLLTVARPVAAFVTALAAGFAADFPETEETVEAGKEVELEQCDDCHGGVETTSLNRHDSLVQKTVSALRYAFVDLLGDLAPYLVVGYLLAGLVALVLGEDIANIPETFRSGWGSYVGAIIVGLPLYICATSSTPLAAVLLGSGFSPGAIMVFLLVGPATNLAALAVVRQILGGRALVRYLGAIIVVSVACGVGVDGVYGMLDFRPDYQASEVSGESGWLAVVSAIVFSVYVTFLAAMKLVRRLF
jgi:uncharacterized membrane protein YraQ (UPF0718 family)